MLVVRLLHAIFDDPRMEVVLLVDATIAYNNINRHVALRNISMNCSAIFPTLANTYRLSAKLFVGEVLLSMEGTTQGYPLAMPMYALATRGAFLLPLLLFWKRPEESRDLFWLFLLLLPPSSKVLEEARDLFWLFWLKGGRGRREEVS